MSNLSMDTGPAWVGIGSMRSGTTWFTDLLCQHPKVALGVNGKKEQWLLNQVAHGAISPDHYTLLFPSDGLSRGEWSPRYMWLLETAMTAKTVLGEQTQILALLRDPIERYASHQRYSAQRRAADGQSKWKPAISAGLGTFIGMYADQLQPWAAALGRDRIMVLTYESVVEDPAGACVRVWNQLELSEDAPLRNVAQPSATSPLVGWQWPAGLRDYLKELYRGQVARLEDEWGLDTSVWPNFAVSQ